DGAVVSCTENLITARARPAVQADWGTPGIGWALARGVGIHACFDTLGGVGDFRQSRYIDRGREHILEMETLVGHVYKGFVLLYGEPAGGAKLVQAKWSYLAGKPVPCVESIGMAVPKNASVDVVGSAL